MANYLRMENFLTMAHPTFDSLADTLKRHRIPLTPMPVEEVLNLTPLSPPTGTGALYLVLPNNPSYRALPHPRAVRRDNRNCARHACCCWPTSAFAFTAASGDHDPYQMLTDAGVDFICTEDTGKTLAGRRRQARGMLVASDGPYGMLKDISDDFLFSVAPFTFEIITRLITAEHRGARRVLAQDLANVNRQVLRTALDQSALQLVNPRHHLGLEWVLLPAGWNATALTGWLHAEHGPQLLPGERFYWADHQAGSRFVRVALLRDPGYFAEAAASLRKLADQYQP